MNVNRQFLCSLATAGLVNLILLGCTAPKKLPEVDKQESARQATADSLRQFRGLGVTLLPAKFPGQTETGDARRTELASSGAPLREVMLTLFKDSGVNLLIDPDVTGTATFDIKGANLEEAFEALLESYDLAYRWDGNFLRISPRDTRTFDIDFPLPAMATSGLGAAASSGAASGSGGGTTGGGAGGNQTSIWTSLEGDLRILAEGDDESRLIVNPALGSVLIEGRPSTLRRVSAYVTNLRRRATQQVSIEARILEVTLNDTFKLGVDFSLLPGFFNSSGTNHAGGLAGGAMVRGGNGAASTAFQAGFTNAGQFSLVIDALEQQGQVRVLSSPRISTLNNVTANIRVVQQVPVIERQVIDSESGSRTEFSVRFEEAGVAVDVTPQIAEDQTITCRVRPAITEVSGFIETPDNLIREPILNTRTLETVLRVQNGQPILLGGLRGKRTSENLDMVPVLGDIPLLGGLFRKTSHTLEETELVIVLMPRILTPAWRREDLRRGLGRLLRLRRSYKATPIERLTESASRWVRQHLAEQPSSNDPDGERRARLKTSVSQPSAAKRTITRRSLSQLSFRKGLSAFERGELDIGQKRIREALALDPDHSDAWLLRGLFDLRKGNVVAAREALRSCLDRAPKNVFAQNNLGLVHLRAGNPIAARGALQAAVKIDSSPEVRNNLGVAHMALGHWDAAIAEFTKVVAQRGDLAEAHFNLAVCVELAGRGPEAVTHYQSFLDAGGDLTDPRIRALRNHVDAVTRRQ